MPISFSLPEPIEQSLRVPLGHLDEAVKEATLVEFYRQGLLSHGQFAAALEIDRFTADGILKRHKVTEDLITKEEFDEQVTGLRKLLGT
jgi:hypothetical protein